MHETSPAVKPSQSCDNEKAILSQLKRAMRHAAYALTTNEFEARRKSSEAANCAYRKALELVIEAPPVNGSSKALEKLQHLGTLLGKLASRERRKIERRLHKSLGAFEKSQGRQ